MVSISVIIWFCSFSRRATGMSMFPSGTTACVAEPQISTSSALCVYFTAPAVFQSPSPSAITLPFSVNFTFAASGSVDGAVRRERREVAR